MAEPELLPCPCCGPGTKVSVTMRGPTTLDMHAECLSCGLRSATVRSVETATRLWNTRGGVKPEAVSPPPEKRTFRVLCQQYVEEVGEFTVEAESLDEALAKARAVSLWEACGDTWEPGDDAQDADIYAVQTEDGTTIWER